MRCDIRNISARYAHRGEYNWDPPGDDVVNDHIVSKITETRLAHLEMDVRNAETTPQYLA